jgi:SPX domain
VYSHTIIPHRYIALIQKIIKELPHHQEPEHDAKEPPKSPSTPLLVSAPSRAPSPVPPSERQSGGENASESPPLPETTTSTAVRIAVDPPVVDDAHATTLAAIVTNPVEQNFFRLLHQEVRKVSYFYHKLMHELSIRYDRIHYNVHQLLRLEDDPAAHEDRADAPPQSTEYSVYRLLQEDDDDAAESRDPTTARAAHRTVPSRTNPPAASALTTTTTTRPDRNRRSSRSSNSRRQHHYFLCNQSIYKLYRDLMFLELYSIMALTSFSKILKKHDKVTGYHTKYAFMTKIVLPANFVASPPMQPMMEQCMEWYDHITYRWMQEQKDENDDSLLFLDMIRRLRSHIPAPQTE